MKNKQKIQFTARLQKINLSTFYLIHYQVVEKPYLQPVYSFLLKKHKIKPDLGLSWCLIWSKKRSFLTFSADCLFCSRFKVQS